MQKVTAIFVLVIYTLLSVVNYVGIHYCHGQVQSIAINYHPEGCCDSDKTTCCNSCDDVSIEIDFELDQNKIEPVKLENITETELINILFSSILFTQEQELEKSINYDSPPETPGRQVYLMNSSFLFYG